jgi:hypothetical protein
MVIGSNGMALRRHVMITSEVLLITWLLNISK